MGCPRCDERVGSSDGGAERTRKEEVIEYVGGHPGAHLREIKRGLKMGMGTIQYHLYTLEREGKIVSRRQGLRKRFYQSLTFGERQQQILDVLSQEKERDMLLFLVGHQGCTQKALVDHVSLSPGTVNWHMKRLQAAGLVEAKREGQFVRYAISGDRGEVLRLLKAYHPGIWEKLADRLADVLAEIGESERRSAEEVR